MDIMPNIITVYCIHSCNITSHIVGNVDYFASVGVSYKYLNHCVLSEQWRRHAMFAGRIACRVDPKASRKPIARTKVAVSINCRGRLIASSTKVSNFTGYKYGYP